MRHVFPILLFALYCGQAGAEGESDVLKGLEIPDDLGPKGRAAVEKFYGRPLVVQKGMWRGVFNFKPGGKLSWVRPDRKVLYGHFGDSAFAGQICLDFSYDQNDCFEVQQQADKLHFYNQNGGQFTGFAQPGSPKQSLPQAQPDFCAALGHISQAAEKKDFSELVDGDREPVVFNELSDPHYWTTVSLDGQDCYFQEGMWPSISCEFFFEDADPGAEAHFESISGRALACLDSRASKVERDSQTWMKYHEIDWVKKSTTKIPRERYSPAKSDDIRRTKITLTNGPEFSVRLGYKSICKGDGWDCNFYYGVELRGHYLP